MSDDLTHIKDLVPDPKNRRTHTPRNVGMIVDALHKVGAGRSIVIDENNEVLAGNATIEAAGEAGITQLKVVDASGDEIVAVRRTGLTTDQKRDLAIYDNRTGELAEWDVDQLLKDVEVGVDLSSFFREDELSSLLDGINSEPVEGLTSPDDVPAPRATDIKTGDLFTLGDHRLLCGDSTKAEDVALVIGDDNGFAFTSPPYLDARDYTANVDLSLGSIVKVFASLESFVSELVINLGIVRRDQEVVRYWDAYIDAAREVGFKLLSWNVWDRGKAETLPQHTAMFPIDHEFLFVFGKSIRKLNKTVENKTAGQYTGGGIRGPDGTYVYKKDGVVNADRRGMGTVFRRPAEHSSLPDGADHPARFPVALSFEYIASMSDKGGVVIDPFLGSGTTLIAAEKLQRRCYGFDIEPAYCQVTIDRWEAFTGKKATKVGSG